MRCPDCSKFVSLESEAEVGTVEVSDEGTVRVEVRLVRKCADCGQELKEVNTEGEGALNAVDGEEVEGIPFVAIGQCTEDEDSTHDLGEPEYDYAPDVEESGGGRYKKNIISATVEGTVECQRCEGKWAFAVDVSEAAGSFEELV